MDEMSKSHVGEFACTTLGRHCELRCVITIAEREKDESCGQLLDFRLGRIQGCFCSKCWYVAEEKKEEEILEVARQASH